MRRTALTRAALALVVAVGTASTPTRRALSVRATGFDGAVDLAVDRYSGGAVYVAELFGGRISRVVDGAVVSSVPAPSPSASRRPAAARYAGVGAFGPEASVVRVTF